MRDQRIDILRFIGLAMIILAHVKPPSLLFQIRNFDVPLMILVSGMSFGLSYKSDDSYFSYVWKRVKRLVFPVWIFLTIYFVSLALVNPNSPELTTNMIIGSFFLIKGIGYVWIIKVFLLVALVSPWVYKLSKNVKSNKKFYFSVGILFILWEIIRYITLPLMDSDLAQLISIVTHYIIPFTLVFSLGLRSLKCNEIQCKIISFVSLGAYILMGTGLFIIYGEYISTQKFKYPPSIYYFSYAFFVSFFLWKYSPYLLHIFEKIGLTKVFLFIAKNTIWVYLWHIPLVKMVDLNFYLKYLIVFFGSVAITYIQILCLNFLLLRRISNKKVIKNIQMVLTG